MIFPEEIGGIPGLTGRLNPIRDELDRVYLYTTNIAVNSGKPQPVYFTFGEELRLTDSLGREALVRIADIVGRSALLEYRYLAPEIVEIRQVVGTVSFYDSSRTVALPAALA